VGEAKWGKNKPGVQLEEWYLEKSIFPHESPALIAELHRSGYGRVYSQVFPDGTVKIQLFEGLVPPQ